MVDVSGPVSRAVRAAPPDQAADQAIRSVLGALSTEVLLAAYRISGLWPVRDGGVPEDGSLARWGMAQRCFSSQQPVRETVEDRCRLHVPLSVWGERLGVLLVELPDPPDDRTLHGIVEAAGDVAMALRAADRETDRYRRERLSMAAELQWELLPGRGVSHAAFELAGQLEPAYTVGGGHFDWSVDSARLTVTVLNGASIGLSAALLTSVTVNALRPWRRCWTGCPVGCSRTLLQALLCFGQAVRAAIERPGPDRLNPHSPYLLAS